MISLVWILYIVIAAAAYLIGSISFSYIFTRVFKKKDIRETGSGNAGTTNVLRNYGWKMGLLTLVCDLAKGVGAAFLGLLIGGQMGLYIAAVFAVVGHNWSVYLKFKGGKGVATTTGVLLVIMPIPTAVVFAVCVLIVVITRYMSVGSIIGFIASAVLSFVVQPYDLPLHIAVIIIAVLGIYSHRENIKRLAHGNENRMSISKKN
jgi:acyl phosphate:glycerol-3-phosphate acyltransferase